MDVSIILVSFNTKDLTKNCIKSVYEKTSGLNFDIYVIDNASKDGSCEMIEQEFPKVKLIKNDNNVGFGAANNLAIEDSNSKYIFLLNTDTILINNAIKILFDFMEKPENKNTAVCGGNLYDINLNPQHSYGNFPSLIRVAFVSLGLSYIFKSFYRKKYNSDGTNEENIKKEVDYITGADMFIRKSILDEVGVFDQDFFLYFEETELSYRIFQSGYKSVIVPEAKIIHYEGGSNKKFNLEKFKIFRTSEFKYFEKTRKKADKYILKILYIIRYIFYFDLEKMFFILKL